MLYFHFSVFSSKNGVYPLVPVSFWQGESVAYTAACYSRYTAARQLPAGWFGRVPTANEYMRGALLL